MPHRPSSRIATPGVLLFLCAGTAWGAEVGSIAFHYGRDLPVESLASFDRVVVEPAHASPEALESLRRAGADVYAYVSIGEVAREHAWHSQLQPGWVLGENDAWRSRIVDPAHPGWRAFLDRRIDELWRSGYRAFFFDTVDAHRAALRDPDALRQRESALVAFLKDLRGRHPAAAVVLNRGFELLPQAAPHVQAVAAESLFQRWNAAQERYEPVPEQDRAWLIERFAEVLELGLEAIAIDYVPTRERAHARQIAQRIRALGITPFVGPPALDRLGVGLVEALPRRVLLLHDGADARAFVGSPAHRKLARVLEHLGQPLDVHDVRQGLPSGALADRYAGLVTWFVDDALPPELDYAAWLRSQVQAGLRVAVLGTLGFRPEREWLAELGLEPGTDARTPVRLAHSDRLAGFEARAQARMRGLAPLRLVGAGTSHVTLRDADGQRLDAVVTTPWGGLALGPYVFEPGYGGVLRWVLDPFAFLERALALEPQPVPDVTTESGRPLLTLHVGGDGLDTPSLLPGAPLAGEVLFDRVLSRFSVPTTLALPDQPDDAPERLIALRRRMLALPHVSQTVDDDAPTPFEKDVKPKGRRRLHPVELRVAFTAGATPAAVDGVVRQIESALARGALPVFRSEVERRRQALDGVRVARTLDGRWKLSGLGALRTLRLPASLGWPDLERSQGVAGVRDTPEGRFVALDRDEVLLSLSGSAPPGPYVLSTNAHVLRWEREGDEVRADLSASTPLELDIGGVRSCRLSTAGGSFVGRRVGDAVRFSLSMTEVIDGRLRCP